MRSRAPFKTWLNTCLRSIYGACFVTTPQIFRTRISHIDIHSDFHSQFARCLHSPTSTYSRVYLRGFSLAYKTPLDSRAHIPVTLCKGFTCLVLLTASLDPPGYYAFGLNPPLAIVGGTGRFVGAQGDLNYVADDSFEFSTPVMRVLTPDAFGASPAPPTPAPTTPAPSTAPPATTCDPASANPNQVG